LSTDDNRLTILSGRQTNWVTVDYYGDVFYSDIGSQSINKISANLMESIANGLVQAPNLNLVAESELEAQASAQVASSLAGTQTAESASEVASKNIMQMYTASTQPHVTAPGGVATDGVRLYWTNTVNGITAGTVVKGEVDPQAPPTMSKSSEPSPFPSTVIANNTAAATGLAKSNTMVFFSAVVDNVGYVFGADAQSYEPNVYAYTSQLTNPQGLVWDGDQTVYVADEGQNKVYSFPCGRLTQNAPLTIGVEFNGPYGVAVLESSDKAFKLRSNAPQQLPAVSFVLLFLYALM